MPGFAVGWCHTRPEPDLRSHFQLRIAASHARLVVAVGKASTTDVPIPKTTQSALALLEPATPRGLDGDGDEGRLIDVTERTIAWQAPCDALSLVLIDLEERPFELDGTGASPGTRTEPFDEGERLIALSSPAARALGDFGAAADMAAHSDAHPASTCSYLLDMACELGARGPITCLVWKQPSIPLPDQLEDQP